MVHVFLHDDGREFVVGTACAKEYFGINVGNKLSQLLNLFPRIYDMSDDAEDLFGCSGIRKADESFNKSIIAKLTYAIITRDKKFISASQAENTMVCSTSDIVKDIYNSEKSILNYSVGSNMYDTYKEIIDFKNASLESLKENDILDKVRAYWESKDSSENTFIYNIQFALKMVNPKMGMIVYAIWEYMKEVEDFTGKYAFGTRMQKSTHIGTIGEKIKGNEVTVYNISSFESQYGVVWFVSMIDSNDNVLIWKTSNRDANKGDVKVIKTAIVKEHSEYKGIKQTNVKNVKFV